MAEWANEDVADEMLCNQKTVLVQAGAPTTAYEGQVWVCTSSDPPIMKVYDDTNTQWMDRPPAWYESVGYIKEPAHAPVVNGTLVIQYNTNISSTVLFMRADNDWWGLEEA